MAYPLPAHARVVSRVVQHLRQRSDLEIQITFVTRARTPWNRRVAAAAPKVHLSEASDVIVGAREEHAAGR